MGIKTFTNRVIFQFNQLGLITAIILMIINVALQTYDLIQFGTYNPYLTILTICILIFLILWIVAYVYNERLKMYQFRRLVENIIYNDFAINLAIPWEIICYMNHHLPIMKSNLALTDLLPERKTLPDGRTKDKVQKDLKDRIAFWEGVLERGYVTKDEAPEKLKKFIKLEKAVWEL